MAVISYKCIRIPVKSCLPAAAMATGMAKKDKHFIKANGRKYVPPGLNKYVWVLTGCFTA